MSLGNLLLQPQRLRRKSGGDPKLEIVQNLMRLIALLAEDAADDGPLAGVMPELINRLGTRIQTQAEDGLESVYAALKAHFHPLFLYFEKLIDDVSQLDEDPSVLLDIVRQVIADLRDTLNNLDQAQIKSQLDFAQGLLEEDLGIDASFANQQISALLNDLIELWQQLPSDISSKRRRRRRLAIRIIKRLNRHLLNRFTLPRISTALAARKLYKLLQSSGVAKIFDKIHCALDQFEQAVEAANEIRTALPLNVGGGSVGAALIEPEGSAKYCWYASWLLSDIDLPLIGTGDIKDRKLFVNLFRTHQGISVKTETVSRFFFSTLTHAQQQAVIDYDGTSDPDDALVLMLVAHLNDYMQRGPIFSEERFGSTASLDGIPQTPILVPFTFTLMHDLERIRPDDHWPEELRDLQANYIRDQDLLLYNRRFLEWVFGPTVLDTLSSSFWRYAGRKTIGSRRDVLISGDGHYLMCDDKPIYTVAEGEDLKWEEAPLFFDKDSGRSPVPGITYYHFLRVSANACDIWAQVLYTLEQTGRPIWHLTELQPGHEIGTGIVSGLDILHAMNMIFFGKPVSGYQSLGGWGKWLANDLYGPRGLSLFGGSFQGLHTNATAGNGWWFWVTVVLGDFIRVSGHNSILQTVRDFMLTFFTLLNSSPSHSGDSSLPSQPAANHLKQGGIISPVNTLFAYLLILNYKRENHSIEIWSADDIGDRREHAFGLWFGGGIGFGLLSGLSGSVLSQSIAWQEDWKLLGVTILESMAGMVLGFWFFEYFFKEGDTADGTLAATGSYKGYPDKATSPYRLPYDDGEALYMGQGNNGLFSHNEITNMGGNWQIYAYDLGHDHRQIVRAMRGGVVWSFNDGFEDNNEDDANFIIIRHDTLVADHDDPFDTGTPVTTFARYWHGAKDGVTNVLGATPVGTVITQGQPIMEADDTGTSFHSHLHIYVVADDGTGNPGSDSIPFVFADVDNDSGVMEFLTWYRAGG
jgi:hypothetical protein